MPSAPNWACSMDSRCRMVGPFCMCCATTPSAGPPLPASNKRCTPALLGDEELGAGFPGTSSWRRAWSATRWRPAVLYLPQFYQAETYVAGRLAAMEQLTMNPRRI